MAEADISEVKILVAGIHDPDELIDFIAKCLSSYGGGLRREDEYFHGIDYREITIGKFVTYCYPKGKK